MMFQHWLRVTVFVLASITLAVSASKIEDSKCDHALGMESGLIADDQLTASSSFDQISVGPQNARIRHELNGGAWCPQAQISPSSNEFLEVNLGSAHYIRGVETQGRWGAGHGVEYVPAYKLMYLLPNTDRWVTYHLPNRSTVLSGNKNVQDTVLHQLPSAVFTSRVRFVPVSRIVRTVCLRLELYGCAVGKDVTPFTYSYGTPPSVVHSDWAHSSPLNQTEHAKNSFGMGLLSDGVTGKDGPDTKIPVNWVAWSKSDQSSAVELYFDLGQSAVNVTGIWVYCKNDVTQSVSVFSHAVLRFGFDHRLRRFQQRLADFTYETDRLNYESRWVYIPVYGRAARFIQMQLFYDLQSIMISEVKIDSEDVLYDYDLSEYSLLDDSVISAKFPSTFVEDQRTVTVYTVEDVPAHYITVVIAITLSVMLLSVVLILLVYGRYQRMSKEAQATAAAYASAYVGALAAVNSNESAFREATHTLFPKCVSSSSLGPQQRDRVYVDRHTVTRKMTTTSGTSVNDVRKMPSGQRHNAMHASTHSSYMIHVNNQENALLEKLGPPPNPPCPLSPPPAYRSTTGSDEDSSEYADADSAMPINHLSDSEQALLPPPIQPSTVAIDNHYHEPTCSTQHSEQPGSSDSADTRRLFDGLPVINRQQLTFVDKLGQGQFGEVHLCHLHTASGTQLVAAKMLHSGASGQWRRDFAQECHALGRLQHDHVIKAVGVCVLKEPWCLLAEYAARGDLNQYLKLHRSTCTPTQLLDYARQVSSGLQYLESVNCIHRDVAARNCLVCDDGRVKVSDFGMARALYSNDYYKVQGHLVLPIRWMSWECLLLGKFSVKSDVWAFGVTVWEILTLCACQPFVQLTDQQVIDNVQNMCVNGQLASYLPIAPSCTEPVQQLLFACWSRDENTRPTFAHINSFLTQHLQQINN